MQVSRFVLTSDENTSSLLTQRHRPMMAIKTGATGREGSNNYE